MMVLEEVQGKIKDAEGVRRQNKKNQAKGSKADMDALIAAINLIKRWSYQHWLQVEDGLEGEERAEYGRMIVELYQILTRIELEVILYDQTH